MKITLGVFAHVDAGKTTFCECLLYQTNKIGTLGRVDHGSATMDHDELEKRRGITIFSDIASFSHGGREYYLIDTPGHIDFCAEMERTLSVLDAAVLLINGADGVQSHTITVCRLLKEKGVPIYIFINKTDQAGVNIQACLNDIRVNLHLNSYLINNQDELTSDVFAEWLCEYDDELMGRYLDNEADAAFVLEYVRRRIRTGDIALTLHGSALRQAGVMETLEVIGKTLSFHKAESENFAARVFKVNHDIKGTRVTFLKCLAGSLKVKDEISYKDGASEKVNELRDYQGKIYANIKAVYPGDIVGITGLTYAVPGIGLGTCDDIPVPMLRPALKAAVVLNHNPYDTVMDCLRKLEAQDPLLEVGLVANAKDDVCCSPLQPGYEQSNQEINISIMGKIQLEVLKGLISERFGLTIDFSDCRIVYRETIAEPVMGYGHFEPLRHYAEVHLRLEPNPGGGISFESELHTDRLAKQYQNLIQHHVMERDHKGILTGSSLTDIRFVLTNAAVHLKHTDGGDLREATYRAVRQGMEKAESVLLEPYYEFFIDVDTALVGRVMSDITRLHGVSELPEIAGGRTRIRGRGPVETFLNYQTELLSFTKGMGAISLNFSGYFPCHNRLQVIESIGYQKERDTENTSSSVFCAKGAGFEAKWHEAENYMHLQTT